MYESREVNKLKQTLSDFHTLAWAFSPCNYLLTWQLPFVNALLFPLWSLTLLLLKKAGVYTNTVVVQRHSVVMTKTDKIYKVRCTYDTTSRNITFGMMPIRDPDMISITSAPEAPAPRIRILDSRGSEVETVRIGDRLTFRIEIPDKTPYGIFARSCLAMAKDARSTFEIIDDQGCPVDPGIFPRFTPEGNALVSTYEAFRFTESYGVIFQCNVKYCLGPCQPVSFR